MSDPGREGEGVFRGSDGEQHSGGEEDAVRDSLDDRATRPLDRESSRPSSGPAEESGDVAPVDATPPAEAGIRIVLAGQTDVGLVRDHNEDNYLVADLSVDGSTDPTGIHDVGAAGCVLAVCDGMGGAAAGEVASQMAVDTILSAMREATPCADRDGFAHALVRAIEHAGSHIFEAANDDRSRRGMGTTATVAALMDKTLFVGQVGDSRAYVLREGQCKQITKDQSLVNQLIEAGQLTEDEAEAFEHSNIILQALGTTDQVSVDLTFLELRRGDRVMLCSDGLSGLVHADVMRDVLSEYDDLSACCARLIELAKAGGGHDNITVIVAEFDGDALMEPAEGDMAGYQQYPLPLAAGANEGMTMAEERLSGAFDPRGLAYGSDSTMEGQGGGSGRYLVVAVVLLLLAFGVYYFTGGGADPAKPAAAVRPAPGEPMVVEPASPQPVEVVVRTDVEGSELHVDGASYGAPQDDGWLLDLPPGPHRLEARAGGTVVASSLVTVREGIPATVFLSMPEVAEEPGGAEEGAVPAAPLELSESEQRELRRMKAREQRRFEERAAEEAEAPVGRAKPHAKKAAQTPAKKAVPSTDKPPAAPSTPVNPF